MDFRAMQTRAGAFRVTISSPQELTASRSNHKRKRSALDEIETPAFAATASRSNHKTKRSASDEIETSAYAARDPQHKMNSSASDCQLTSKTASIYREVLENLIAQLLKSCNGEKEDSLDENLASIHPNVMDIDDENDPLLCSVYANEIYRNYRAQEIIGRPRSNLMETMPRDMTRMRGIVVCWLILVSEHFKLAPDTLYLTVHLIDRFLSQERIERQKLQLVGITCMLIASKYEEGWVRRVDDYCDITDNSYSKHEVLKMETRLLKCFGFKISVPTAKSFLRRFLRAAQASYGTPNVELECLSNYLAELTLIDCGFLKYLPSIIAASAVFLARWTLDQSSHPWNSTLEHYTSYKASQLEPTAYALQALQLNASGCPLHALHSKYMDMKFKSVAGLSSPKLPETLFRRETILDLTLELGCGTT